MTSAAQNRALLNGANGVRLRLLGEFKLIGTDGGSIVIPTKKNRGLLAILALSPGRQATRERLCGLLWGDRGEEQARSSLRQSLAVLRKELGEAEAMVLQTQDDLVQLQLIATDVTDLLALGGAASGTEISAVVDQCQGELLADTSIREEAFETWLAAERGRIENRLVAVLERACELENGHSAVTTARRLVELDPLREASHRLLMRAYHGAGEMALALQQFEYCKTLLANEFGVAPAAETTALRTEIMSGERPLAAHPDSFSPPSAEPAKLPSIAVIPFVAADGNEQVSDGLTVAIIFGLGCYHDLIVIDQISSFTYKRNTLPAPMIAKELRVDYLLSGTTQVSGGRVRVTVELIAGLEARQIWSHRYERDTNDVFAVQTEISETIVATLMAGYGGRLRKAFGSRNKLPGAERLIAFDLLSQALDTWDFTHDGMERVRTLLNQAIACDPSFAKAYGKMAWSYMIDAMYGLVDDYDLAMENGREWALAGVGIDDSDSWALWALAGHDMLSNRHEQALQEFRRAVDCNPNDAEVITDFSLCLSYAGHAAEGIEWALKAMRLNPHHHEWYTAQLGQLYFDARYYDMAISTFARLRSMDSALMRIYQAASLAALSRMDEAAASIRRALEIDPGSSVEKWSGARLAPYAREEDRGHLRKHHLQLGWWSERRRKIDRLAIFDLPVECPFSLDLA